MCDLVSLFSQNLMSCCGIWGLTFIQVMSTCPVVHWSTNATVCKQFGLKVEYIGNFLFVCLQTLLWLTNCIWNSPNQETQESCALKLCPLIHWSVPNNFEVLAHSKLLSDQEVSFLLHMDQFNPLSIQDLPIWRLLVKNKTYIHLWPIGPN